MCWGRKILLTNMNEIRRDKLLVSTHSGKYETRDTCIPVQVTIMIDSRRTCCICSQPLTNNRTGLLDEYFLPEVMCGQLNVTNTDEY